MREMLEGGDLDVLTGDYLAELTMLILGRDRREDAGLGYARTFLTQLRDCLRLALDRRVKIVTNAGGVNPSALATAIRAVAAEQGLSPTVALVRGDELGAGRHAYLGGFGIARAMDADIVVTGRVTDASLVVGPAVARFGWGRDDLDRLAGATVAGHVIECGTQATGGNYPFFTEIEDLAHPGFPIAEVHEDGSSVITKHPGTGGAVTVGTVTAQLVYEVQDARYLGPDVTTRLDTVSLRQEGPDRVRVDGVRGEAPPPTLKVSQTAVAGYRNEMSVVLTGLDIEAKAALFRRQFEAGLRRRPAELTWDLARLDVPDAATERQASALLTVVARDPEHKVVDRPFSNAAVEVALGSYPGFFATTPPGPAHPYGVFTAGFVPQDEPVHEVVHDDGSVSRIAPPVFRDRLDTGRARSTPTLLRVGTSRATGYDRKPEPSTRRLPLGTIVGARSGDKGGDANVGLWVRDPDAYPWLANLIVAERVRELLPETADRPIRITELPNILAVNVVIEGLLGQGVAYGARFDPQAKGLGEWLRSRHVDIPLELLEAP
ncbi:acyclic terpene utilization AtuA family protein [Actinoplanes sp. CA-030573]|uniref:acyclic terpene utilization AtuA family protein n=1 Tax=Actinoplanes sp. CA-030573 TaxID=3239898 RepID=UPI003D9344B1